VPRVKIWSVANYPAALSGINPPAAVIAHERVRGKMRPRIIRIGNARNFDIRR